MDAGFPIPSGAMQDLEQLLTHGPWQQVLASIAALDDKGRHEAYKRFKTHWKARRPLVAARKQVPGEWTRFYLAQLALAPEPSKAFAVPTPNDSRDHPSDLESGAHAAIATTIAGRGREWAAAYVAQAATGAKRPMYRDILVMLVRDLGLALPTDGFFVEGWARAFMHFLPGRHRTENTPDAPYQPRTSKRLVMRPDAAGVERPVIEEVVTNTPEEGMRTLPGLRPMIAALLGRKDAVLEILYIHEFARQAEEIAKVVGRLVADGDLDRRELVAAAVNALTRGDSVSAVRLQARLLLAAQPDAALVAEHAATLQGLLASGAASAADTAQTLLRRLDDEQPLDAEFFQGACQMVFARKEKGMKDAQLAWAAKRAEAYPAQVDAVRQGLQDALLVDDLAFRRKATALLEKLGGTPADVPAAMPPLVVAALREPVPEARPLRRFESPPASAGALREALAQHAGGRTVVSYERIVDLVLRLAREDRAALRNALQGIGFFADSQERLESRIAEELALHGANPTKQRIRFHQPFPAIHRMRDAEFELALRRGIDYAYLARPTWENGSIEPGDLVERLSALAAEAREVLAMDLLSALLRTRQPSADVIAALRAIGSREATVAGDFFAAGGTGQLATAWHKVKGDETTPYRGSHDSHWLHRNGAEEVCVSLTPAKSIPDIAGIPVSWAGGFTPETAPDIWEFDLDEPRLTGILPNDAEVLAARHLWGFRKAAGGRFMETSGGKATALSLPCLTFAGGTAGPALHLAVFYAMSAEEAPARLAGSDALVELVAQRRYESALACELAGVLLDCGSMSVTRLAASLGQAVQAGAGTTLWPLVRAMLARVLAKRPAPAGANEFVALAHGVASRIGARDPIDGLAQAAAQKGASKLVVEARRLHELLAG